VRPRFRPRPVPTYDRRRIRPDETYIAYHLIKISDRDDERFIDGFKSRSELGLPPRGAIGENAELASGISAYDTVQAAIATARAAARRGRDLGGFVAEIRLVDGLGFEIAVWGGKGHLTIWGDPLMLALHVTDIVAVMENGQ
jgi:hypothetical protein